MAKKQVSCHANLFSVVSRNENTKAAMFLGFLNLLQFSIIQDTLDNSFSAYTDCINVNISLKV